MKRLYKNNFSKGGRVVLGRESKDSLSPHLYRLLDKSIPLTKEEQLVIAKKLPAQWAREELLMCNLRFIFRMTSSSEFSRLKLGMDDKFMSAVEGFLIGLDKWKPEHNCGVLSYCVWWIRSTIQNRSRETPLIRVPESVDGIRNTRNYLMSRGMTDHDIIEGGDLSQKAVERIKHAESLKISSLDTGSTSRSEDFNFWDVVADENATDPSAGVEQEQMRATVSSAVAGLAEDERVHVKLRYEDGLTYKQIGKALGFSHEQARIVDDRIRTKLSKLPELIRLTHSHQ
tara:strand:+ start:1234 stop:2091 length:858 start_codon:yes stop_codon:yes gene_type:complete